jgi:hypothetical protein
MRHHAFFWHQGRHAIRALQGDGGLLYQSPMRRRSAKEEKELQKMRVDGVRNFRSVNLPRSTPM